MFLAIYICILPTILTLPGTSRLSPTTADYSADHAATKPRIETYCTDTKDQADTSAQFKKCFRKLTSLQTGAAFSLLPSRLRYSEEKRYRKRNQSEIERERERGEGEGERRLLRKYLSLSTILHPGTAIEAAFECRDRSLRPSSYGYIAQLIALHFNTFSTSVAMLSQKGSNRQKIMDTNKFISLCSLSASNLQPPSFPPFGLLFYILRILLATLEATLLRRGAI